MASFFLGSYWGCVLCLVVVFWYFDCGFATGNGSFGGYFLQREVSSGEGCFSVAVSLGHGVLLLWGDQTWEENEEEEEEQWRGSNRDGWVFLNLEWLKNGNGGEDRCG